LQNLPSATDVRDDHILNPEQLYIAIHSYRYHSNFHSS